MNKDLKLILIDTGVAALALYLAFLIRFEFAVPSQFTIIYIKWIPFFAICQLVVFYFSGLHTRIWRYTSLFDLYAILRAVLGSCGLAFASVYFLMGQSGYPRSVLVLYFIFNSLLVISIRLGVRVYYSHYHKGSVAKFTKPKKSIILIGAGKTGEKIAKEMLTTSRHQYHIVGFVDDNSQKHGALLHGRKVLGNVLTLLNLEIPYDEIIITAPSATGDQMRKIVKICKQTGKKYKTVPGIGELIDGEVTLDRIRDVNYSDLLGREEVSLDEYSISKLLKGKRVLITGAGGSIGSELVKQCIYFKPSEIICLDNVEEKIYSIEEFYRTKNSKTIIKPVLASVTQKDQCEKIFSENRPQIVIHAAAYKHVPIMELYPWAAISTNLEGTYNIAKLSDVFEVDKFVLVSTDKAVNPVNIMGASKRAAEKLIQSFNLKSKTTFMAVRFGNVLGSSGSAIPTFQRQINNGGPITITHPEMTRYFMSIQEASQLILQCGALGKDGEIFLLEMGKPIKITQMARDLIRLSGLEPDIDIPIVYTGLRPGEKLYEELQMFNEKKVMTKHKKNNDPQRKEQPVWHIFKIALENVIRAAKSLDKSAIQFQLKQLLPTYQPTDLYEQSRDQSGYSSIKGEA